MTTDGTTPWTEEEYVSYLRAERRLYAWCLLRYGGMSRKDAASHAEAFYEYEEPEDPCRGLVFHDEAWHWAMRKVLGEGYWMTNPGWETPSAEYRAEALRIEEDPRQVSRE